MLYPVTRIYSGARHALSPPRSPTRHVYLTSNTTASCYARTHAETVRQERERREKREREREFSPGSPIGRRILEVAVEIGNSICAARERESFRDRNSSRR